MRECHNLNIVNGKVSLAYAANDGVPWHRLGTPVTSADDFRRVLAWSVLSEPIYLAGGKLIDNRRAIVRSDTGDTLGIVTERYQPIQNVDAFAFLDSLVDGGELQFSSVGALGLGERVFASLKMPDSLKVGKNDAHTSYLSVVNSHDGLGSFFAFASLTRMVCQNTFRMAMSRRRKLGEEDINATVRHTGDTSAKLSIVADTIKVSRKQTEIYIESANKLAETPIQFTAAKEYFATVLDEVLGAPVSRKSQRQVETENANLLDSILEHGNKSPIGKLSAHDKRWTSELDRIIDNYGQERAISNELAAMDGSAWQAYNAVTGWVDHQQRYRGNDRQRAENRMESILCGKGANAKAFALETILSM